MNVKIQIDRHHDIAVAADKAMKLFDDLEKTLSRFPKLRKLNKVGDNAYVWEMSAIGSKVASISHEVSYGAQYSLDRAQGRLSWKPVPKKGNATVEGCFEIKPHGKGTRLRFDVKGELRDVPVPLMYRLLAPAFIQGKFAYLVDGFLQRIEDDLSK